MKRGNKGRNEGSAERKNRMIAKGNKETNNRQWKNKKKKRKKE